MQFEDMDEETQSAIRWKAEKNRQDQNERAERENRPMIFRASPDFIENNIASLCRCGNIPAILEHYRRENPKVRP